MCLTGHIHWSDSFNYSAWLTASVLSYVVMTWSTEKLSNSSISGPFVRHIVARRTFERTNQQTVLCRLIAANASRCHSVSGTPANTHRTRSHMRWVRKSSRSACGDGWRLSSDWGRRWKKKSLSENHIYVRAPPSAESIPFPRHFIEPRNNHLRHFYKCSNNMFVIFRLSVRLTFMFSLFHIFNADIKVL